MADENFLSQFSGKLPLFPLPKVVQFPYTMLPLHIYEERYRKMLQDALEGENLFGTAVLKPGWEDNYQGNPEIYETVCLGKIVKHQPLDDGRSNIMLLGLKRAQIQSIVQPFPYRLAQVAIMEESYEGLSLEEHVQLKHRLLSLYGEVAIELADSNRKMPPLSDAKLNLSQLCDALAVCLQFSTPEMVNLLNEPNVQRRASEIETQMNTILKRHPLSMSNPRGDDSGFSLN